MNAAAIEKAKGMSKTEVVQAWLATKAKSVSDKMKSKEMRERTENAGLSLAAGAAAAVIPAWIFERNPDWQYLDEGKTIESEAVVAVVATAAGLGAYIADIPRAEVYLVGGLVAAGSYVSKVVRARARQENAEEAALAAQTRQGRTAA